mmetsp:Transcript_75122/g.199494  ORF Transcript_75122/g.199494 Transcript_75122/m.199494 type:complete len:228 (+) Transcript_75122:342-1025(+)
MQHWYTCCYIVGVVRILERSAQHRWKDSQFPRILQANEAVSLEQLRSGEGSAELPVGDLVVRRGGNNQVKGTVDHPVLLRVLQEVKCVSEKSTHRLPGNLRLVQLDLDPRPRPADHHQGLRLGSGPLVHGPLGRLVLVHEASKPSVRKTAVNALLGGVHKDALRSAPAKGLYAGRSRTGEEIEDANRPILEEVHSRDLVEESLANALHHWPDVYRRLLEPSPPRKAG